MTTGDVVYSLRFSLIKILPELGFDLGMIAGESSVLTARLHMLSGGGGTSSWIFFELEYMPSDSVSVLS